MQSGLYRALFTAAVFFALVAAPCSSAEALSDRGYKALHNFTRVLNYIEENYVTEVDDEKLIQGAVEGMVNTLDPHSVYMSPEVNRELKVDTSGRFDGIGVEVAVRNGTLVVVAPMKDSPADKADIRAGDHILRINGQLTKNMNLGQAVTRMRGRRGSKVTLTIHRESEKRTFDVVLVRQIISVPSVRSELLENKIGYVSISSFQQGTSRAVRRALARMSAREPLNALILDLRHNPGGLLEQGVEVADIFLSEGLIVTTDNRGTEVDRRTAHEEGTEPDYPMMVLIDNGSASAAEIVAGALKDNRRADVLGLKSFGKGSVQTVIDLDDGSGLKITVAYYRTPSGQLIQDQGIIPDVVVEPRPPKIKILDEEGVEVEVDAPKIDYQKQRAIDLLTARIKS